MAVATGGLYFNFAWFREQLCIVICPYGRIQSALTDDHTLVIGYDTHRGEPRGKHRVSDLPAPAWPPSAEAHGDCVACNRCVQVCPTGIDIRQGLQMECIGCAGCIDACDEVMTRVGRPRGLIRYDSQTAFARRRTRWIRPRTVLYGVLLLVGASVATWALSTVHAGSFSVTRLPGAPYLVDAAAVRNQFLVRLVNKRPEPATFVVQVTGGSSDLRQSGCEQPVVVPAMGEEVRPLILQQPRSAYTGPFQVDVQVRELAGRYELRRQAEFLGPEAALLREQEKGGPQP
jgi:cytochrome c oxidase accessory protein FixG